MSVSLWFFAVVTVPFLLVAWAVWQRRIVLGGFIMSAFFMSLLVADVGIPKDVGSAFGYPVYGPGVMVGMAMVVTGSLFRIGVRLYERSRSRWLG